MHTGSTAHLGDAADALFNVLRRNEHEVCKLVYDADEDRLAGVQLIGPYASEMIYGAAMMVQLRLPLEQLKKIVFPHPTVAEVIREGLFML